MSGILNPMLLLIHRIVSLVNPSNHLIEIDVALLTESRPGGKIATGVAICNQR